MILLNLPLLQYVVHENSEVGMSLAERLARRLFESREWIADVALDKVSARLTSLLLRLLETEFMVDREGVGTRTPYTHEQIGARRVAVSRAISKLLRLEEVEVKGQRVYLRDETALKRAAEVTRREV